MLRIEIYQDIGLNNAAHLNIAYTGENEIYVYALASNINVSCEYLQTSSTLFIYTILLFPLKKFKI